MNLEFRNIKLEKHAHQNQENTTHMCVLSRSVVSDSLRPRGLQPTRLLCPWGFSRQEYQSGLPRPLPGDLPNSGVEPRSLTLQADSLLSEPPGKPNIYMSIYIPGVGNGNPLQYSCLENPMDGGAWQATVHRVTQSQT